MRRWLAVIILLAGVACGGPSGQGVDASGAGDASETRDAGSDAALPDVGAADASGPDAAAGDAMPADAAAMDAGMNDSGPADTGAVDSGRTDAGPSDVCVRSLCMAGAFTRSDGANPDFRVLCERLPGLVFDSGDALFAFGGSSAALEALIQALDSNQDGRVDAQDDDCDVVLGGYSWGAVNVTHLAQDFIDDARVDPSRGHVQTMFVIDPYAPTAGRTIEVPAEVQTFWEYRHSISPSNDCSGAAPLGPYEGLPPLCAPTSACQDYDYSLAPRQQFMGLTATRSGMQAGHCTVVDMAGPAVLHNVMTGQAFGDAPPSGPVGAR